MAHFSQNSIFFIILGRFLGQFCRNFITHKDYLSLPDYIACVADRHNLILISNIDVLALGPNGLNELPEIHF